MRERDRKEKSSIEMFANTKRETKRSNTMKSSPTHFVHFLFYYILMREPHCFIYIFQIICTPQEESLEIARGEEEMALALRLERTIILACPLSHGGSSRGRMSTSDLHQSPSINLSSSSLSTSKMIAYLLVQGRRQLSG